VDVTRLMGTAAASSLQAMCMTLLDLTQLLLDRPPLVTLLSASLIMSTI